MFYTLFRYLNINHLMLIELKTYKFVHDSRLYNKLYRNLFLHSLLQDHVNVAYLSGIAFFLVFQVLYFVKQYIFLPCIRLIALFDRVPFLFLLFS